MTKSDIENLRLVSKRVNANASPFLVTEAHVSFNRNSIRDLETLSNHSVFSKSIKCVQIDVSYYDKLLAKSCHRFVEHNASKLGYTLDLLSRATHRWYDKDGNMKEEYRGDKEIFAKAYRVNEEWNRTAAVMATEDVIRSDATEAQKLLLTAYEEYKELYDEQQAAIATGQGVERVAQALHKMTSLDEIVVKDLKFSRPGKNRRPWVERFYTERLIESCLKKSRWKGSFMTAMETRPPVHIVTDLFAALADSSVRPASFTICITPPTDLRCIDFTSKQLETVRTVLAQAKELSLDVLSWERRDSLAENNDRPKEELTGLCALSRALFSSSRLQGLRLSLGNYPCFYELPKISLFDLLPMPLPSNDVSELGFQSVPLKMDELRALVDTMKDRIKRLALNRPYLLDGSWADSIAMLRDLEKLEWVDFKYPYGGEYGDRRDGPKIEHGLIESYISGKIKENPLQRQRLTE
ncbi:uncharacterized protein N0V89_002905 [Didymosphaeria variabile]|uniref:Uncharacterized protein n=1 Tax=Didymosphaeria variabile TaxID=1932322 RepID=A0A9W8XV19_9PLEO|nr:uncharacterized protein N0V89_002905 [Didymosphaeria variabile]KAJ4358323.1 hypothetical protein N0V89_002905 [Didymosphaeria variabile]